MAELPAGGESQSHPEPRPSGPEAPEQLGIETVAAPVRARGGREPKRRRNLLQSTAAGSQAPEQRDKASLDVLAILEAVVGPLRAHLDQATAERRELQTRLDALAERVFGTQLEANQARADAQAEQTKREAAEAQANELRERLDHAQARVDRLEFEVSIQRKAQAASAAIEADGPARRRWWWPF